MVKTKIYLDCCCLNRPFDDQSDPLVHLEAEAIKIILALCEKGFFEFLTSEILKFEIEKTPEILRREKLKTLESIARKSIKLDEGIIKRAKIFEEYGVKAIDALHLACAEREAQVLLTVDRKFLKKAKGIEDLKIEVKNPIEWLMEVFQWRER